METPGPLTEQAHTLACKANLAKLLSLFTCLIFVQEVNRKKKSCIFSTYSKISLKHIYQIKNKLYLGISFVCVFSESFSQKYMTCTEKFVN